MKILHLGQYYAPYSGGIETYTQVFCEGLGSYGLKVHVIVSNNEDKFKEELINGVQIYRLPRKGMISSRPFCPTMPAFIKKKHTLEKFNVIHLHFPNLMTESSYLLANLDHNYKLFLTYHTDAIAKRKEAYIRNFGKKIFLSVFVNRIFKECTGILLSSNKYAESRSALEKFKEKCYVVPIPVDSYYLADRKEKKVVELEKRYGRFILFVGNFVRYKGVHYLIEAMKNINANLVLVGNGPEENNLRRLITERQLQRKVYFVGRHIKDNGLKDFYDACAILCLPSIQESYGIVLLEAMACGKPVISTEIGTGTSWVNQHGETGFVVPPRSPEAIAKAINELLSNETMRQRMGENAKNRIMQHFTVDKAINQLIKIYNS